MKKATKPIVATIKSPPESPSSTQADKALVSPKPMTEGRRRGRLMAKSLRMRTNCNARVEQAIASFFPYPTGFVKYYFTSDPLSDTSIGAEFFEGDLVLHKPISNPIFSTNHSIAIEDVLIAKMRVGPDREMRNLLEISDKNMDKDIAVLEKILSYFLNRTDMIARDFCKTMNQGFDIDSQYALLTAVESGLSPLFVRTDIANLISDFLVNTDNFNAHHIKNSVGIADSAEIYNEYTDSRRLNLKFFIESALKRLFNDCDGEFSVYFSHSKQEKRSAEEFISDLEIVWFPSWQTRLPSVVIPQSKCLGITVLSATCDNNGDYHFVPVLADEAMHNRLGKAAQMLVAWKYHVKKIHEVVSLNPNIGCADNFHRFMDVLFAAMPSIDEKLAAMTLEENWFDKGTLVQNE